MLHGRRYFVQSMHKKERQVFVAERIAHRANARGLQHNRYYVTAVKRTFPVMARISQQCDSSRKIAAERCAISRR